MHVLLAALQITWGGVGYPRNAALPVPAILADPPQARRPRAKMRLRALEDGAAVPAEWSADPTDALELNGGYVAPAQYRGYVRIRAAFGNESATLPAFAYDSAAVNCYMGFPDGLRFGDDGVANPSGTPENSDIYQTGPANQPRDVFRGCTGAFIDSGPKYVLHVPYGGTVLRYRSGAYFGAARVSQWRNDFTIAPVLNPGDILLFKTQDGRVVKMLDYEPATGVLSGAYLVGPHRGEFADYAAFMQVKYVPHAIFGNHR